MTDRDETVTTESGADQWFESMGARFYWRRGRLDVYALRRGKPSKVILSLPAGTAAAFREWLCELVDVSR